MKRTNLKKLMNNIKTAQKDKAWVSSVKKFIKISTS